MIQPVGESHTTQHFPGDGLPLFLGHSPEHEGQGNILGGSEVGKQVIGLEHEPDVPLPEGGKLLLRQAGDGYTADIDTAPGGCSLGYCGMAEPPFTITVPDQS